MLTRGARFIPQGGAVDVYDDELDDSFDLLSSGPGMRALAESADDIEAAAAWTKRHLEAEMAEVISANLALLGAEGADAAAEAADAAFPLPHT